MFAGRVGSWERLQYRVRIEPNMQGTDGDGVSGVLTVPFAPNLSTLAEYLKLTLALSVSGTTTSRIATVQLGSLTWTRTDTAAITAHELVVEFEQPRWYNSPLIDGTPAWEFRWSGLRIYINGVEVTHTLPTTGSVRNDTYFAPAGLPMTMARLHATATAGSGIGSTGGPCQAWAFSAESSVRVVGGWRIREHGANDWTAYPIRVIRQSLLGNPCGETPPAPELGGSDTWSAVVFAEQHTSASNSFIGNVTCRCPCPDPSGNIVYESRPIYRQISTTRERATSLWIVPDLPREFVALGENLTHEYLMYRAKFPQVHVARYASSVRTEYNCETGNTTPCSSTQSEPVLLHPQRDELLYVHDAGAGNPLNEPMGEPLHCPYTLGITLTRSVTHHGCPSGPSTCPACPPGYEGSTEPCCASLTDSLVNYTESHTLEVNAHCHPHYRHDSPPARYWNTHAAPLWSYICWLQNWLLDRDGNGVAEPTPVADYWRPHQCQHIEHPALPSAIRSRRRSYLLLDALAHGTWSAWIDDLFGVPSGWVGSVRPALVEWLPPGDLQLTSDSAPRWSATGATLAFTPLGVSVAPTTATHTLEFALADWNAPPFLYPAVADRVRIWLPDTAYTSIAIQLVSAENETVTIATTRGTHPIPSGEDTKYAGTWRRQYAALAAGYSELGSDWDADGVSNATFSDPARATLWQLLGARAGARLRITITQTITTPYVMEYPIFYRDGVTDAIATDNGAHTYPHVRGDQMLNWGLLAYPTANNTPSVRLPHQPMTLYDAAALYRQLERGLNASATIDIIDQIRAWGIDDVETGGHPAGVPRVRQMCRAVMLPYHQQLALWLINDLRECPALPTLPTRRLRLAPPAFTGDWGQWCYFAAPSSRYYLAPTEPAKLIEVQGGSETELTLYDRAIGRYHLTRQAVALDGTETLQHATKQWRIRAASRDLGRTTPFFSHALVPPRIEKPEGGAKVVIDTRRQWLHVAIGSTLRTYHLHSRTLLLQREYDGRIECLERDSRLDVLLIVVRDGATRVVYLSRDAGDTATEILRMTTAGLVVCAVSPHATWCAFYQGANDALMLRRTRDGGATWETAQQVQIDGASATGTPLDAAYDARYNGLVLVYETTGGDRRVALSFDEGETFSTILS
jgi:hypothetical protein